LTEPLEIVHQRQQETTARADRRERKPAISAALHACLESQLLQAIFVVATFCLIAGLHRSNDGLWFQGDSPRHAANGLFWWDLIATRPASPTEFALRYYARYPVINPIAYPPLFYLLEGSVFRAFGPSPFAAKCLVLAFGILTGLYTMAWARARLGAQSGWTGAFLAFVPGFVVWTNAVMLNVPAAAFGIACLYHYRKWSESGGKKQLMAAALAGAAAALTYYLGAIAVFICLLWALLLSLRGQTRRRKAYWMFTAIVVAVVPLLFIARLAPVFVARHLPGVGILAHPAQWIFYIRRLPALLGPAGLLLGLNGLALALATARLRREGAYLVCWILAPLLALPILPARDLRYILLVAPAFVIAAAIGLGPVLRFLPPNRPAFRVAALLAGLATGIWMASLIHIPENTGFRDISAYLRDHAPADAVMYDGYHDGLFAFYVRALDPNFERRIMLGQELVYYRHQASTFRWVETVNAASTRDVVQLLRTKSGCRWVALEVGSYSGRSPGPQLLRQAVAGSDFTFVRSFPVSAGSANRIDLYRMLGPVTPVTTIDVRPASYSNRIFSKIAPVTR